MKPIVLHTAGAVALTFAIAACVPAPAPTSTPAPQPERPMPRIPPPAPVTPPHSSSWMDIAATPGNWQYGTDPGMSMAWFGTPGQSETGGAFVVGCDSRRGQVFLGRRGIRTPDVRMTIRTETRSQVLTAGPLDSDNIVFVHLNPRDPLLDAMALSKGRFAVEVASMPTLYLPSWAEVTRAIEDCR